MAPFQGFIAGSYQSPVPQADRERSGNWYPEVIESPAGKTKTSVVLRSKPGLAAFAALAGAQSVRAECTLNGRAFAIFQTGASNDFVEVFEDGTTLNYGSLPGDTRPQLCPSQKEVLILAGGNGYLFDLTASTLSPITAAGFPTGATKAGFLDGYFLVLEPNSQAFALSGLNDGTSWDPLDFGDAEGQPGNVVTFVIDHRQVWFLCVDHGEIYYDSGNANFPLTRLDGAFMEQGASSIDGAFKCDNTIFWQGGNEQGQGVFWRANGYTPQRISTHAIEALVARFGTISDSTGYCYQEQGHTFARWDFPSAYDGRGASLLYDVASGFWHERFFWHATLGLEFGDLARTHMFCFGKHLVGDWRSGTIYEQSMAYATDAGAQIRRIRQAPDLANGGQFAKYSELRLLAEVGVGLDAGGALPTTTLGVGGVLYYPPYGQAATWTLSWEDQNGGGDQSFGNGFTVVACDGKGGATITFNGQNFTLQYDRWGLAGGSTGVIDNWTGSGALGPGPVSLGSQFKPGQPLTIGLWTNQGAGCYFVSGPASANADHFAHAKIYPGTVGHSTDTSTIRLLTIPEGGAPAASTGVDPQILLQVSNDGGKTWSLERPASLGKIGDTRRLVRWRRLGRSNNRAFRVICSEPVDVALVACDLDASQ